MSHRSFASNVGSVAFSQMRQTPAGEMKIRIQSSLTVSYQFHILFGVLLIHNVNNSNTAVDLVRACLPHLCGDLAGGLLFLALGAGTGLLTRLLVFKYN